MKEGKREREKEGKWRMKMIEPIILETSRLVLKGFTPEDMTFIFEQLPKEEIKKLLGHRSDEEFQKEESKQKKGYATYNRSFVLFLLIEKETQTIFGRCGLHNWNADHSRAEIGYSIEIPEFKQKGFMSEAVESIIAFGFRDLKLNRIEALVGEDNIPSLKIISKFNFTKEGLLREHFNISESKFENSLMFSLLKSEYKINR